MHMSSRCRVKRCRSKEQTGVMMCVRAGKVVMRIGGSGRRAFLLTRDNLWWGGGGRGEQDSSSLQGL